MLGIRITFSHRSAVPPSAEVLEQGVRRAAVAKGLAVEHLWVAVIGGESHAVVFLRTELLAEALAAGAGLAREIEVDIPGIRFTACAPVTP